MTYLRTSDTLGEIAAALAKAQASFGEVRKDKVAQAGSYSYNYADLSDVLRAVRVPLCDNGLAIVQPTLCGERTVLLTRLIHSSGEWIEASYPLGEYAKPQDMGSALTYARRYALTSLLGITAEDDDDGQAAQQTRQPSKTKKPVPAPARTEEGGEPPSGDGPAPPSSAPNPVLPVKRGQFRRLCADKGLDPDEQAQKEGALSLEKCDLETVEKLIEAVK